MSTRFLKMPKHKKGSSGCLLILTGCHIFSDKNVSLIHSKTLLPDVVEQSFWNLKSELEGAALVTIFHYVSLILETDASDIAIIATLKQNG